MKLIKHPNVLKLIEDWILVCILPALEISKLWHFIIAEEDGLFHTACGTPNYVAHERMTIPEILDNDWFKKDYKPLQFDQEEDVSLDDIDAVFNDSEEHLVTERKEKPVSMNAFELNSRSQGFSLENLFEKQMQPQQLFMDTTNTKIFVGGLAWETKSDMLRRYFEPYGEILEAVVINDKHTGRSKGYGFVTFRDPEAVKRACANPSPVIDGRKANCNLASLGRPVRLLPPGNIRSASPYIRGSQTPRGLYVGNPIYQLPANFGYQPGVQFSPYRCQVKWPRQPISLN